ncbi:hypothetical protein [Nostoc sp.]|uniref:hypothetical protein n=1 Tax=Nostoc sp. TaxID=1180 RepID=UPI002FF818E4
MRHIICECTKVKEEVGENTQTVWLINWEEPLENDFAIASLRAFLSGACTMASI